MSFVRLGHRAGLEWALVLEAWDSPPSWFEVPDVDGQPALADVVFTAFEGVLVKAGAASAEVVLGEALDEAGDALQRRARGETALLTAGSGAFVAAALGSGGRVAIAWAGRARVYRVRGGHVEQVSRDHVLSAQGNVPAALKRVVTRHLVSEEGAEVVDAGAVAGDRFVLVSAEAAELMATHRAAVVSGTPQEAATALLDAWPGALASAGVAVVDVVEG